MFNHVVSKHAWSVSRSNIRRRCTESKPIFSLSLSLLAFEFAAKTALTVKKRFRRREPKKGGNYEISGTRLSCRPRVTHTLFLFSTRNPSLPLCKRPLLFTISQPT